MVSRESRSIYFPAEGVQLDLHIEEVAPHLFTLIDIPILVESANVYDIVEVKKSDQNTWEFVRVVKASRWTTYQLVICERQAGSPLLATVERKVVDLGGLWSRIMGGVLLISLPPDVDFDPSKAIDSIR